MDDTAYRNLPGASWTTCFKPLVLGESPAQVRHRIDHPDEGDTAIRGCLRCGHCLALQPEVFDRDFLVYEGRRDKRHKAYQAVLEQVADTGQTVLTPTEHRKAQALADAVRAHPMVAQLLAHPDAQPEAVLQWDDPIVGPARGRADLLVSPRYILDLKQWRSVQPRSVRRDIEAQGVDAQLAWYARGAEDMCGLEPGALQRGVIVVSDGGTDGCPECALYWLDEAMHALGDARLDRALRTYAECVRTGQWPTAGSPEGDLLGPSEWLLRQYHLTDYTNT